MVTDLVHTAAGQSGSAWTPDGGPAAASPRRWRTPRFATACLLIGAAALVPGLVARAAGLWPDLAAWPQAIADVQHALADIRFGSGLRFWLGVAGACMMVLLLAYPLRKALGARRGLASVASWYRAHVLLGTAGPVLVLYHCNFSLGGSNANAALWAMLAVVAGGVAGMYVHGRVSHDFHAGLRAARGEREAILSALPAFDGAPAGQRAILAALDRCEADLAGPRRGIVSSLGARYRLERHRAATAGLIGRYFDDALRQAPDRERAALTATRNALAQRFRAYVAALRLAAGHALAEQAWARWRLFHLPVFLVMVAAAGLHVAAVWDLGADDAADPRLASAPAPVAVAARPAAGSRSVAGAAEQTPPMASRRVAVRTVPPVPVAPPRASIEAGAATESSDPRGAPVAAIVPPAPVPAARALRRIAAPMPASPPTPAAAAAPRPRAAPAAAPPADDIQPVVRELQRRIDQQPMALGAALPRPLATQIADYKARMAAGSFAHAEAETGFALTGKHLKVDCASCHKAPLKETRAPAPRQCVDCHRKDDVHKGRRPMCVTCHTTNRWTQILRRK